MTERDYSAAIAYLTTILDEEVRDEEMVRVAIAACRENLRQNPDLPRSSFTFNDRRHGYGPNRVRICPAGRCELVFDELRRDGSYSAPTYSHAPIATGTISVLWPLDDLVVRLVHHRRLIVYNVTLPKHILFPGYVKVAVEEYANATVVAVSGRGGGNWAYANERGGPILFRSLLDHLAWRLRSRPAVGGWSSGGGGDFGGAGASSRW